VRAQIIPKLEYYSSRECDRWNNGIPIIPEYKRAIFPLFPNIPSA